MNTYNYINKYVILEFVYVNIYQMIVLNTFGQNMMWKKISYFSVTRSFSQSLNINKYLILITHTNLSI